MPALVLYTLLHMDFVVSKPRRNVDSLLDHKFRAIGYRSRNNSFISVRVLLLSAIEYYSILFRFRLSIATLPGVLDLRLSKQCFVAPDEVSCFQGIDVVVEAYEWHGRLVRDATISAKLLWNGKRYTKSVCGEVWQETLGAFSIALYLVLLLLTMLYLLGIKYFYFELQPRLDFRRCSWKLLIGCLWPYRPTILTRKLVGQYLLDRIYKWHKVDLNTCYTI